MIRRPARGPAGDERWILISQVDHAQLAGKLAEHWSGVAVRPLEPRDEVLAAVYHHDDGWGEWEQAPDVDSTTGRPYDFTEMPLVDSLAIWQRSIDAMARLGPLQAWLVSSHFDALLQRARSAKRHDIEWLGRADEWLARQDAERAAWLAAWQSASPATHSRSLADRGFAQLQMFDILSLWFCCAERTQAITMPTPGGEPLSISPLASDRVELDPWPLAVGSLELAVAGRSVPATRYASREALAAVPLEPVRLRWTVVPPRDSQAIPLA